MSNDRSGNANPNGVRLLSRIAIFAAPASIADSTVQSRLDGIRSCCRSRILQSTKSRWLRACFMCPEWVRRCREKCNPVGGSCANSRPWVASPERIPRSSFRELTCVNRLNAVSSIHCRGVRRLLLPLQHTASPGTKK